MDFNEALTASEHELLAVAHRTVAEKWRPFLLEHGSRLAKNHGWELRFFSEVLSQVPSLRPEHVSPQHPFQDMKGGRRYIDFAVRIDERRLAVEVDGFDKTGEGGPTPESHVNFTERQNALSLQGWNVLRFTNRQFSRDPTTCIQHLEMTVRDMVESSAQSREALKSYLQGLESELRVKTAAAQGQDRAMYEEQQKDLKALLASTSSRLEAINNRTNTVGKVLLAAAILFATAGYALIQSMDKGAVVVAAPAAPTSFSRLTPIRTTDERTVVLAANGSKAAAPTLQVIAPSEAASFVGQTRTVCGNLAQVAPAIKKRPWYLSFDAPYPRQTFQAIVWPSDVAKVEAGLGGPLTALRNSSVCVTGKSSTYQGAPQIRVSVGNQLVKIR